MRAELRRWFTDNPRTYPCRVCSASFEAYRLGRHWYCDTCRLKVWEAQREAKRWVSLAIRTGVLMPATAFRCVDCDEWADGWEHRDYSKPLSVEPTCDSCNHRRGPAQTSAPFFGLSACHKPNPRAPQHTCPLERG